MTGSNSHPIDWTKLDAFTLEAWVRDWRGGILSQGNAGDPENSIYLGLGLSLNNMGNQPTGWESGGRNVEFAIGSVPSSQWIHVAMVYDGKNQAVYVNGQLKRQVASPRPGPFDMRRKLLIGRGGEGTLRSIRVSSTVCYRSNFRPAESWKNDSQTLLLLEASQREGELVKDLSNQKHDAKVHGMK